MKTETCKLYSRDFWIFLPNIIKIDPYNLELYRFKVGPFFETQCICAKLCWQHSCVMIQLDYDPSLSAVILLVWEQNGHLAHTQKQNYLQWFSFSRPNTTAYNSRKVHYKNSELEKKENTCWLSHAYWTITRTGQSWQSSRHAERKAKLIITSISQDLNILEWKHKKPEMLWFMCSILEIITATFRPIIAKPKVTNIARDSHVSGILLLLLLLYKV